MQIYEFANKMSDEYSQTSWRFEGEIKVTEAELRYAAKSNDRNIMCTLEILYPFLNRWYEIIQNLC